MHSYLMIIKAQASYNYRCLYLNPFPHTAILQQTTLNIFCLKIETSIIEWITYD